MSLTSRIATIFPGSPYWTAAVTNNSASDSPAPWSVERVYNPSARRDLDITKWSFNVVQSGTANNAVLNLQANNSADEQGMLSGSVSLVVFVKYNNNASAEAFYVRLAGC